MEQLLSSNLSALWGSCLHGETRGHSPPARPHDRNTQKAHLGLRHLGDVQYERNPQEDRDMLSENGTVIQFSSNFRYERLESLSLPVDYGSVSTRGAGRLPGTLSDQL